MQIKTVFFLVNKQIVYDLDILLNIVSLKIDDEYLILLIEWLNEPPFC